jgi:NB-ARC domain-containing protein
VSTVLLFAMTAVLLPLLLTEFGDWCPWLAVRLVRWSARRLGGAGVAARYEEEWTANLNEVPGKVSQLVAAFGYLACVPRMRLALRRARETQPPAPAIVLGDAPALDRLFSGRLREVETLKHLLLSRQPRHVAILGAAGTGKTALAAVVASVIQDRFPDGCCWITAHGREPLALQLRSRLATLGVLPTRLRTARDENDYLHMFGSLLSKRKMLVILDDVEDSDQARKLLAYLSNCWVIITSRRLDLAVHQAASVVQLVGLPHCDAVEVLHEWLRSERIIADDASIHELIQLCGGMPRVAALAASILAESHDQAIAEFAERLSQCGSQPSSCTSDGTGAAGRWKRAPDG